MLCTHVSQGSSSQPLLVCSVWQLWKVRGTRWHFFLSLLQGDLVHIMIKTVMKMLRDIRQVLGK